MPCESALSITDSIDFERLVAPREHLGMLIEPHPAAIANTLRRAAQASDRAAIMDTTVGELRKRLRERLGLAGPVVLTGHQAEFSHAGVFAKTLAVAAIREAQGGRAVFLSVDSDLPTANRLIAPVIRRGCVRRRYIPIPGCDPQLPIESQALASRSAWRSFFDELAQSAALSNHPLLDEYTAGVFRDDARGLSLCSVVERGYEAAARSLALGDITLVRMSELCNTPEFRAFVAHLALNAAEFACNYNDAQREYRVRRRERNPRRPAPLLEIGAERVESPFWATHIAGRRHRLFVGKRDGQIELYADEERIGTVSLLDASRGRFHDAAWPIEASGWRIRPRALTLSAFTRLFLSDLFVHGVGGARYDEMTENFIDTFMGVRLPPACCMTATLRLPLPTFGVDRAALASVRHARRDIHFNPQRHLADLPADLLKTRRDLIARSRDLRTNAPHDRAQRRAVFDRIRKINHELLHHQPTHAAAVEQRWLELERHARSDRVAGDREYFFALHPASSLRELRSAVRAAFGLEQSPQREAGK